MPRYWKKRLLCPSLRFHRALRAQYAGRVHGPFRPVPADAVGTCDGKPLRIHFWTPHAWFSSIIHVERVVPLLRERAAALGLPWQITFGDRLPEGPPDWLLCLKGIPPASACPVERTVLLIPDDADRAWGHLKRFGHVMSVTSRTLASLLGSVHPRVWFMDETESPEWIEGGRRALDHTAPSKRRPLLFWHGTRNSMLGLRPLRPVLETFARETAVELVMLTGEEEKTAQWGHLRVRHVAWSPENLAAWAAQARLSIVPARPTLADSYLKNAGRLRRLYGAGSPAIGDARVADVAEFSKACGAPVAQTPDEWLGALRLLWNEPVRLDEIARRGNTLVRERFSTVHTAAQWLWFFCSQ